ncbi:MAG: UDP-2,3-diacylglucosamine diphosphatase LpxI [Phycisphaerae bacterium]|nr:UDP-2,3-diacylglucosamine diphosphatase LpxI [Phycisphaerae bacterium]
MTDAGTSTTAAADEPVGLIAGAGRLPMLVADGMLAGGNKLVVAALRGFADPKLEGLADEFHWIGLTRMGGWIRFLRRQGVRRAVLIGSVRKGDMHCRFRLLKYIPDLRTARIWYGKVRKDKRDNAVLLAVADELAMEGIELMSSVEYCKEHLAEAGLMTRTPLPRGVEADVEFGWRIAQASADLDIGQSIAVKERDIIAVEAVEGTDAMIARAGQLCSSGGWTLIKVARPNQDMRFDVPTVGPQTLRNLAAAKCSCLVLQADKTLIADKPATLVLADKLKIAIIGKAADTSQL